MDICHRCGSVHHPAPHDDLVSPREHRLPELTRLSAKNIETVLVNRFLLGCAGSIGATLVGGTISDIYMPEDRGLPMAVFAFFAMLGTGLGPVMMAWVEANPRLEWRWIQWIELSTWRA